VKRNFYAGKRVVFAFSRLSGRDFEDQFFYFIKNGMRFYISHAGRETVLLSTSGGMTAGNTFQGGLKNGNIAVSLHPSGPLSGSLQRVRPRRPNFGIIRAKNDKDRFVESRCKVTVERINTHKGKRQIGQRSTFLQ
jgi:hypothetical protein